MKIPVGWWASDDDLVLATGKPIRGRMRRRKEISISADHRSKHIYCIGQSGSGKSRFLRSLAIQDIDANRGVTVVDSQDLHLELLNYIAELAFPGETEPTPERLRQLGDKLVIIEPGVQTHGVPGINLLELQPGQVPYSVVDAIIEILKQQWPELMARGEDINRHSLLLLREAGLTVLEMLPFLTDRAFRNALVERCRNPELRMYFREHLHGIGDREVRAWMESSRNRWAAFLLSPFIRPLLAQSRSTINFRSVLDEGKWLIIAVSRDRLKESRRLLGPLLIAQIHAAAISRERAAPHQRIFHHLMVDEFQEVFTPAFLHILEGSRKYGLGLTLSHQNLKQPPFDREPGYVDTTIGNTSTLCVFNVARKDAERLAGEMFFTSGTEVKHQRKFLGIPLETARYWGRSDEREHFVNELMRQRRQELYIKLKGVDADEPYFCTVPNVPDMQINHTKIDWLRQHVASRYYRPVAQIEREIAERWRGIRGPIVAAPATEPHDFTR